MNTIQLEPVPGNLVIDRICLASDACNVRVLVINLFAHRATELVEVLGHAMKLVCLKRQLVFAHGYIEWNDVPKLLSISFSISSSSSSASNWNFERAASELLLLPCGPPPVASLR